ncbi:MAG: hypothetical protein JRK53_27020 [Deltaproteobacteria bacterium]|nr:hypothetical protein [Deltaproteobacteria bacterium]
MYSLKLTRLPSLSKKAVEKSWAAKQMGARAVRYIVIPISRVKFLIAEYSISKSAG